MSSKTERKRFVVVATLIVALFGVALFGVDAHVAGHRVKTGV